ncbi:MAG: carboxypeptidase regulatory-like domain-containing protein [Bryobacterales bacterium]|nr:carboxypeptidase regulatory-like domain-containing protein [Bryobacterales bacterium]
MQMLMRSRVSLVLLVMIASSLPGAAQTFGEITGTITDSTGAAAAGASVTLLNTATSQARKVDTNEAGNYTIPFVPPGLYEVRVQKDGFKSVTRPGVRVQLLTRCG